VTVIQKNDMPDFGHAALRCSLGFGPGHGAVHEIKTIGRISTAVATGPETEYGFAVGGGIKVNLPQLARL
jgi:hypothetical protein